MQKASEERLIPQTIQERAAVSPREAGFFFNMSESGFKRRFRETNLNKMIRSTRTHSGLKLDMYDVVKAAFPEMSEQSHALMIHMFLETKWKRRAESKSIRARAMNRSKKRKKGADQ